MTISTILAIVFGWLFVMSVFTPPPFLLLYLFCKLKKKFKNWKLF